MSYRLSARDYLVTLNEIRWSRAMLLYCVYTKVQSTMICAVHRQPQLQLLAACTSPLSSASGHCHWNTSRGSCRAASHETRAKVCTRAEARSVSRRPLRLWQRIKRYVLLRSTCACTIDALPVAIAGRSRAISALVSAHVCPELTWPRAEHAREGAAS